MKPTSGKAGRERKPDKSPQVSLAPQSAGRRWLFRLLALILLPVVTFGVLEAGLRLAGYGYDTGLFKKARARDQDFLVNNDSFSLRFFPPEIARYFGPIQIAANKPSDTFRIFVFGESAAMGDPEPAFGAIRYLEVLLRERFPQQKFEVVNVALTAINSHVILPIARDCAREHGDLWIIYMGNNEMVGPFGAATVFGAQAPPLALVRLSLAIQRTRTGQLLMALARKLRGRAASASSWGGMEMFIGNELPPDSPRKETVYRNFRHNLRDIVQAGLDSGARVVLNTVAVNLKDCPPFASLSNSNFSAASAQSNHAAMAKSDTNNADAHYRWGQSLLQETNLPSAREQLQAACDTDALPFRTDSRINSLIRQERTNQANGNLALLDAATILATNQPSGLCGQETFYEHVHFNFAGNYRLGLLWAQQVEQALPAAVASKPAGPWASPETCDRLLGLSDWNKLFVIQGLIRRCKQPPLSEQSNNDERLAAFIALERELNQRTTKAAVAQAREDFHEILKRSPEDHYLHASFADFLEAVGDTKAAIAEWQHVQELLPQDSLSWFQAGRLLARQGELTEAQNSLLKAVALHPALAEGWYELANVQAAQGQSELALANYDHAIGLRPHDAVFRCQKARTLSKLNRHADAIEAYRQAIRYHPEAAEAHFELGNELVAASQKSEAKTEYEEAIRLRSAYVQAHLNLGVLLAMDGQFDEALRQFDETLRLEPGNQAAREYFDRVEGWKKSRNR